VIRTLLLLPKREKEKERERERESVCNVLKIKEEDTLRGRRRRDLFNKNIY